MKINNKLMIFIISFCAIISAFFIFFFLENIPAEDDFKPIFKVDKIILFSSAGITDHCEYNLLETLDIHHFTDIAVYIDNRFYIEELTPRNTIRELSIYNISISSNSNIGERFVNYKNPLLFGRFAYLAPSDERIDFDIITTNYENLSMLYNYPVFFADASNPISLGYLNLGVVTDYSIEERLRSVTFDGSILGQTSVRMEDLRANVSFRIRIVNNLGEAFFRDVTINNVAGDNSLLNRHYIRESNPHEYYFLRY